MTITLHQSTGLGTGRSPPGDVVPGGEVVVGHLGKGDHRDGEHLAVRFHLPTYCHFSRDQVLALSCHRLITQLALKRLADQADDVGNVIQ